MDTGGAWASDTSSTTANQFGGKYDSLSLTDNDEVRYGLHNGIEPMGPKYEPANYANSAFHPYGVNKSSSNVPGRAG